MRNSVKKKRLRVELQLFYNKRSQLRWFDHLVMTALDDPIGRCFGHVKLGGDFKETPEHVEETMAVSLFMGCLLIST